MEMVDLSSFITFIVLTTKAENENEKEKMNSGGVSNKASHGEWDSPHGQYDDQNSRTMLMRMRR